MESRDPRGNRRNRPQDPRRGLDLEGLQGWLAESAEDIRLMAVTDTRTPVEAKEALDAFKRSSKPKRTGKPDAVDDVTEMPETIDMAEDEKQADW